jgi:hypothetical protein
MKKELFDWFCKKEKTFTVTEINDLVEKIKVFNAGAIDQYLTNHVDETYEAWLEAQKEK